MSDKTKIVSVAKTGTEDVMEKVSKITVSKVTEDNGKIAIAMSQADEGREPLVIMVMNKKQMNELIEILTKENEAAGEDWSVLP